MWLCLGYFPFVACNAYLLSGGKTIFLFPLVHTLYPVSPPSPLMPLSQSSACCNYRSVPPYLAKSFIFCRVELFQTYGIVLLHSVACLFTPLIGAHFTPKPGVEFRTSNMPDKPFIPVPHVPQVYVQVRSFFTDNGEFVSAAVS